MTPTQTDDEKGLFEYRSICCCHTKNLALFWVLFRFFGDVPNTVLAPIKTNQ